MRKRITIDPSWPLYYKDRFLRGTHSNHILPNSREHRAGSMRKFHKSPPPQKGAERESKQLTKCATWYTGASYQLITEAEFLANPCGTCLAYYHKAKAEGTFIV